MSDWVLVALNAELDTGIAMNLMLGDCLERMKEIPDGSVDMVLCDPPYATTDISWDSMIDLPLMWKELRRVLKESGVSVFSCNQPFTSKLLLSNESWFKYELVWAKTRNSHPFFAKKRPLPQHETLLVFGNKGWGTYNPQMVKSEKDFVVNSNAKGRLSGDGSTKKWDGVSEKRSERYPTSVITISNPSKGVGLHPTQKPVALMEYLIKTYTQEGETVLDFVMGSGTTGVACKNTGRKFIGIEKDAGYFEIAKQRLGV